MINSIFCSEKGKQKPSIKLRVQSLKGETTCHGSRGGARWAELDDPPSFCFSTAGLWTSSWLRLALIDWPVRVRRCAHGQNEPRCCTQVNKCLLRPPGKLRVKPEPLPSSQQSPPSTDRIGQDGLIHKTATWLLELHHAGFWPCMD